MKNTATKFFLVAALATIAGITAEARPHQAPARRPAPVRQVRRPAPQPQHHRPVVHVRNNHYNGSRTLDTINTITYAVDVLARMIQPETTVFVQQPATQIIVQQPATQTVIVRQGW